jgi:hypothetical protein
VLLGWAGSVAMEGEDKNWRRGKDTGRLRRLVARVVVELELETLDRVVLRVVNMLESDSVSLVLSAGRNMDPSLDEMVLRYHSNMQIHERFGRLQLAVDSYYGGSVTCLEPQCSSHCHQFSLPNQLCKIVWPDFFDICACLTPDLATTTAKQMESGLARVTTPSE